MTTPISLVTKPSASAEIKADVVRLIKDALREAENGNVLSVVMIVRYADGTWGDNASATTHFPDTLGRLEILKYEWIKKYIDAGG